MTKIKLIEMHSLDREMYPSDPGVPKMIELMENKGFELHNTKRVTRYGKWYTKLTFGEPVEDNEPENSYE